MKYYRSLFNKNGSQDAQIIIATHSEYVLRSALEDRDNILIIVLSDDNGRIHSKNITAPTILPTITSAETNYLAFGILSVDYHIELYGYLQNKTGNDTVKSCDDYIAQSAFFKLCAACQNIFLYKPERSYYKLPNTPHLYTELD